MFIFSIEQELNNKVYTLTAAKNLAEQHTRKSKTDAKNLSAENEQLKSQLHDAQVCFIF
jgi:hypothetical protein